MSLTCCACFQEFGANGGKSNVFERLSLFGLHVGIEIGGPLIPDLVGSSFRNLEIHDVGVGLRFYGGNVAEMWVSDSMLASWTVAGIQLRGYAIRVARSRSHGGEPADEYSPLQDADGREIYLEQIPAYALEHDGAVLPCPPYCAPPGAPAGSREIGGGQPSVVIERLVASSHVGWLVDSDCGAVRMQSTRLEGQAGLMRNTGLPYAWQPVCANASSENCGPIADGRFTDILIDVSNSYGSASKPANETAISFDKPAELHLIGGSIGSNVVVGNGSVVYDVGVRWQSGGHIAQAAGTAGAKIFGMQQQPPPPPLSTAAGGGTAPAPATEGPLRAEVAQLRADLEALRRTVAEQQKVAK